MQNFYDILGVSQTASGREIKSAYRRLAHQYHPDKSDTCDNARFISIKRAYDTLSCPETRSQYDHQLKNRKNRSNIPIEPLWQNDDSFARYDVHQENEVSLFDVMIERLFSEPPRYRTRNRFSRRPPIIEELSYKPRSDFSFGQHEELQSIIEDILMRFVRNHWTY